MCRPNIARNVCPSNSYQLSRVVFRGTKGLVSLAAIYGFAAGWIS